MKGGLQRRSREAPGISKDSNKSPGISSAGVGNPNYSTLMIEVQRSDSLKPTLRGRCFQIVIADMGLLT